MLGTHWEQGEKTKKSLFPPHLSLLPITNIFEDDVIGQFHVILSHPFLVQKFGTRSHNKFSRKKKKTH
jgi:hypothetical protein